MGDYNSVTFSSEESAAVRTAIVDARSKGEDVKAAAEKVLNPGNEPNDLSKGQAAPEVKPAEQPKILGKFNTQADLEKAYKELEAKLGAPKPPEAKPPEVKPKEGEAPKPDEAKPPEEQAKETLKEVGLNLDTFSQEYSEKGELSPDSYAALEAKGIPKAIVDSYIEGQKAQAAVAEQALMTEAGFKDVSKFGEAVEWAKTNWEPKALESYNKAVATNNPEAVKLALASLREAHEGSMGNEPKLKGGGNGTSGSDTFASTQEMADVMKTKEYKTSEEFRRKVAEKLQRSNIW